MLNPQADPRYLAVYANTKLYSNNYQNQETKKSSFLGSLLKRPVYLLKAAGCVAIFAVSTLAVVVGKIAQLALNLFALLALLTIIGFPISMVLWFASGLVQLPISLAETVALESIKGVGHNMYKTFGPS